jgi:hypothetical protein
MCKWLIGLSTRLIVILALLGVAPVSVSAAMATPEAMTMMHAMPMHHPMGGMDMPAKKMPCCSYDCACVASSCTGSLPPIALGLMEQSQPASKIAFDTAMGVGISFPPSIRPPIQGA